MIRNCYLPIFTVAYLIFTFIGCVMKIDVKNEISMDVIHILHLISWNMTPQNVTKAAETKVAIHNSIQPIITKPQGRSQDFFFFFLSALSAKSTTDIDVPLLVSAVSGLFPSRSLDGVRQEGSPEPFSVGWTSNTDATGFDFSFSASATRDGRLFRGRDFRKMRMIKKLTGNTIMLLTTPMYILNEFKFQL